MYSTTYIDDLIYDSKEAEISYTNLNRSFDLELEDKIIKFPVSSLVTKYRDALSPLVREIELTNHDKASYNYRPKLLSDVLYGTTELWFTLLSLNNFLSIVDFKPSILKYYDPQGLDSMLNEILILEGILV